jgi:DNA-directed RNA polymerase subunit RPC12/RpoP
VYDLFSINPHTSTMTDTKPERIEFTCTDCGKEVSREPHEMDVGNLTPTRCVSCVFDRMSDPDRQLTK